MPESFQTTFEIAAGASESNEVDLGPGPGTYGVFITSTGTGGTDLEFWVSSTAGGTKYQLKQSTGGGGGAVTLVTTALGVLGAYGLNEDQNARLSAFRFLTVRTTANTTVALSGIVDVGLY